MSLTKLLRGPGDHLTPRDLTSVILRFTVSRLCSSERYARLSRVTRSGPFERILGHCWDTGPRGARRRGRRILDNPTVD